MITYDEPNATLNIQFMIDDFTNMKAAKECQFLMVTRVPDTAKKNAGSHNWQVVACWHKDTGSGKNRRIGYLPQEIAKMLERHIQDNPDYIREGSYARWDAALDQCGIQDSEPWGTATLRLYSQTGTQLFERTLEEICANRNVKWLEYDADFINC